LTLSSSHTTSFLSPGYSPILALSILFFSFFLLLLFLSIGRLLYPVARGVHFWILSRYRFKFLPATTPFRNRKRTPEVVPRFTFSSPAHKSGVIFSEFKSFTPPFSLLISFFSNGCVSFRVRPFFVPSLTALSPHRPRPFCGLMPTERESLSFLLSHLTFLPPSAFVPSILMCFLSHQEAFVFHTIFVFFSLDALSTVFTQRLRAHF